MITGEPLQAPFTRLGPGQSVRLVHQVLGNDGLPLGPPAVSSHHRVLRRPALAGAGSVSPA